ARGRESGAWSRRVPPFCCVHRSPEMVTAVAACTMRMCRCVLRPDADIASDNAAPGAGSANRSGRSVERSSILVLSACRQPGRDPFYGPSGTCDRGPDTTAPIGAGRMITVDRITKRYATVTAVDEVSFDVARGEIFALLGPNGAGKTTLLRMLLGLMEPDSGSITFEGYETRPAPHEIGYLPEDRGLYPDVKVLDTLVHFGALRGMSRRAARDAAARWLGRMKLADRAGEPLKALSKGNQQKVQ